MSLALRPYQADLLEQARARLRQGVTRLCLQSSTGSGKTVLCAQMLASAAARGRRAWFIVHRRELVDQSVTTFVEAADIHTGVIAAGYPSAPLAPVQVCSVQTLAKRLSSLPPPDLLVWDECHHLASETWATIARVCPHATQIGLTATPMRLDGKGLGPFFDALLTGPSTQELIRLGYLSPYRLYAPSTVDMAGVHRVAGDYNRKETAETMARSTVTGDAVQHYLAHCNGRALVFVWSRAASQALADTFAMSGVEAEHVDGETPKSTRLAALARFRRGDLRVLCNVDLFGEGLDVPAVDAVFLLRPTQSLGLYLQQVGRGFRPAAGKSHVAIFDHAGNWQRHGLPDDARAWSLADGQAKRSTDKSLMLRRCAQCFGIFKLAAVCPYCGLAVETQAREVRQEQGVLQEMDLDALRAFAVDGRPTVDKPSATPRTLGEWQAFAKAKGYKPQWAWVQFSLRNQRRRSA